MTDTQTISTKHTGYLIHGSTGCTCCSSENFIEGIKTNSDDAMNTAISHKERKTVCSQYSETGIYSIIEIQYEKLLDGRIIIGDRIFDDEFIYEHGETANDMRFDGKTIITA